MDICLDAGVGCSKVFNGSTTNGTIVTDILANDTNTYRLTVASNQSGGYHNSTFNWTWSSDGDPAEAVLDKLFRFYAVNYSGFNTSGGVNYTRTLAYSLNYTCASQYSAQLIRQIDGVDNLTVSATCDNATAVTSSTFQDVAEGLYNISFLFNASYQPTQNNEQTDNDTFFQDLNAPVVANLSLDVAEGFVDPDANATLTCTDTAYPDLTYNMTFNTAQLFYGNLSNGTAQTNATTVQDGTNTLIGVCSDAFSSVSDTLTTTIYYQELVLIDEQENAAFNLDNVTRARVYFDDNSTFYDFTDEAKTSVNFTESNQTKLRFEFVYEDGGIITRWVDVTLTDSPLRVCINKEGVTHFEQLIISSSQQRAVLDSVFSDCTVGADFTRFAYQDSYVFKAFTIPTLYSLYTYDTDGTQTLLASMDGSISSFYNLDTLEFAQSQVSINIQPESVSFRKTSNSTIQIYYRDTAQDNTDLSVEIYRMDTGATVLSKDDFANQSEITIYFDYSTLLNVTDNTLFQLILTPTDPAGSDPIKRYFNTAGSSGAWTAPFAAAMSFFLLVFGLSFTITRSAFSWFGIFMVLIAIVLASMGTDTWYIILIQVVEAILLLWIGILMYQQNAPEVA